ncbi:Bug family tripartite tricarboxylate transporter substrate binding protein [Hydrogenophaga sp. BPS33]|uniref:Bug family tripartite tricarboxylate transporter substrate binding protein n=1 Tax=Hydrogenophaga sp. BPS33 TaxID=2651974 RepID=UPI00132027CD|nr:tripartite tricarboxylate transporter substrate binding protein [Hydrogenophaga sp. BPS33]QHE83439.1 tripartite tricarboxylate transporter substrate binding protein [Hydrogenophaga sp. BPS33]
MYPTTRFLASAMVGVASIFLSTTPASAQASYPDKPIRFVVPYSAGGPTDIVARAVGQKLTEALGQTVIIDNKPGGNEIIGADHVAKSAPDGYTFLFATDAGLSLNKYLYAKLPYDPEKDFAPVTRIADAQMLLVAPPGSGSLSEFVARAKTTPGAVSYASAGLGNTSHLAMEWFASLNQITMTHVPYKGAAAAFPDLASGRVSGMFTAVTAALPQIQQGKLIGLAMSGPKRLAALPNVPTFNELGYKDFEASFYLGLVAPKGTPPAIVNKIAGELRKILTTPQFKAHSIDAWGLEPVGESPAEFAAFLKRDFARSAQRIKIANVKLD